MGIKQDVNEGKNCEYWDNLRTKLTAGTLQGEGGRARKKPLKRIVQRSGDNAMKKLKVI